MTFPVVGSNIPSAYQISNSLRFNDDDSPKLQQTISTATSTTTFTYSTWVKRSLIGGSESCYLLRGDDGSGSFNLYFRNDIIKVYETSTGSGGANLDTLAVYRDTSAWYHVVFVYDTTQATDSNRVKIYVNGVQQSLSATTWPSQNYTGTEMAQNGNTVTIGNDSGNGDIFDGYMAETHFVDGQALTPSNFGESDLDSGVWKPKQYEGTYGTNGFYLKFNNTGNMGEDSSGNDNTFTPTNLSGTTDVMPDSPTNNFATLNSITPVVTHTLSEASLKSTNASGTHGGTTATINYPTSGKWYHEVRINAEDSSKGQGVGIGNQVYRSATTWGNYSDFVAYLSDGTITAQGDAGYSSYGVAHNAGDIIGVAYNADDQQLTFYHNNSSQGVIVTSSIDGTIDFNNLCPIVFGRNMGQTFNFGQDSSFAGATTRQNNTDGNGYGDFYYTPPSGYLALCTQNLATELSPTIDDGSQYFNTVLWSGNSVDDRSITGVGFAPDLVSIKNRSASTNFYWYDTTRGADNQIISNATNAEQTITNKLQAFESDGVQLGTSSEVNASGNNYVGWNWKANGGTTSSNTDGSITSTVQANTTAGFSIITYTGTGASATVGHGLTKAPEMVICKQRTDAGTQWQTGHTGLTNWTYKLLLNSTAAESVNANVFPSAPTSTVINLGLAGDSNGSGKSQLIYAFHSVEGYSKFGSYTGNGSTDGTFVYTGFRPAFVIVKCSSSSQSGAAHWIMYDIKRNTYNVVDELLYANLSNNESANDSSRPMDILSNGFKLRGSGTGSNASGSTYIYMAFAENPFVTSGSVPVTAR